ncbi:MAG: hypothetical protein V2A70_03565 [Candidatus Omnitrophota bacterium]
MFLKSPRPYIVLMALCVLGLFLYANTLSFPFVQDDVFFIRLNPFIGRWDNILDVFLHPAGSLLRGQMCYYRPLLEVFYRLEYHVFGFWPFGFHLVNVTFHGFVAWLVYVLLRQVRCGGWTAFVLAVIFLVHPLQTEAVACVSGISNLMVGVLMLGALIQHIKSRRLGKSYSWLSLFLAAASFLAKEQGLVLVALVALYEILYRKESWVSRFRALFPFGMLAGFFLGWRAFLFPGFGSNVLSSGYELWLRFLSMPRVILTDLRLMVWPADLHYYRSLDILAPSYGTWLLLAGMLILGVVFFRRISRVRQRTVLFGAGFALITVLPVLNIFPLINEYSWIMVAEHFLYLPLAGVLLAAAGFLTGMASKAGQVWRVLITVVLVVILSVLTIRQNMFWRSEVVLFERTLAFEPGLGRVELLLAAAYARDRRFQDAASACTRALRIMENYVKRTSSGMPAQVYYRVFIKNAHHERAFNRLNLGDLGGAREDYEVVLSMTHAGIRSAVFGGNDSAAANNLGVLRLQTGDKAGAAEAFWQALQWDSRAVSAMNNLGLLALDRQDRVLARFWFGRAVKIAPGFKQAADNYMKVK